MIQSKHFPFWIFTSAILCALILPTLLKDGMFMDGLLYACISKNLSEGIGNFWHPHFSTTLYSFFDQQPPLGFGIQSLFFKLFGESMYVERFYSFLSALLTAGLIIVLWRIIFKNENEMKKLSWLPVLFWITIPVCFWAYSNNVLENTMGIFDLFAIIFLIRFFQSQSISWIILSGVFVFLASLTKGFQGMFPFATVFLGWLFYRNISFRKMLIASFALLLIPFLLYFLIMKSDSAHQSLTIYMNNRVLNSIQNIEEVSSRFYLLMRLLSELLPLIMFSVCISAISKWKNKKENKDVLIFKKHILFFLLIGISASFPLMITMEQRGFYLVTSFPYYAIALTVISAPWVSYWIEKIDVQRVAFRIFRIVSILSLVVVFAFSFLEIGEIGRDADMIHDVHLIGKTVPKGTTVGSTKELWKVWPLQEYLVRHYYICQDDEMLPKHDYLLLESENQVPSNIKTEKVNIPTVKYHLYKVVK